MVNSEAYISVNSVCFPHYFSIYIEKIVNKNIQKMTIMYVRKKTHIYIYYEIIETKNQTHADVTEIDLLNLQRFRLTSDLL